MGFGGPNKQGGLENYSTLNKRGGSEVYGSCAAAAEIQNTPISVAGRKCFSEFCHIYIIHYLGNSTKVPSFCRLLA